MSEEESTLSAWGSAETKYFYELTPDKILDAVEAFGFRCTGRCLALNSMENRVYEVEIEPEDADRSAADPSERFRIVKFYRPGRWTREQILEEHEFLRDLAEHEIPAVAPVVFADGETLKTAPQTGIWCAVFPKLGGRAPDELQRDELPIIGRLLARLHQVGSIKPARHRVRLEPASYGLESLQFLQKQQMLPPTIESMFADCVKEICDRSAPWFEAAEAQRIHGDCHLGNLLYGRHGFFWVDFDDMVRGPCIQDLWLILPGRDQDARERLDILISAYEQMRELDRRTLRLIEPLRALRMIHFSAWIAKRWEDPAFQRTFVEFGTERYWQDLLQSLREQLALIRETEHAPSWY